MNPLPRKPYPSDLTDEQWAAISSILLTHTPIGRPVDPLRVREYLDAILYVLRTGCPWRHLPHDYEVNWSSVHKRFLRWTRLGLFDVALHELRESARETAGRNRAATAANTQDRTILPGLIKTAKEHCPDLRKIWADKGYTGPTTRELAATTGIDIDIVSGTKDQTGFKVQPRRWVVEPTHAWINRNRRLVHQWETSLEAHAGFLIISQIAVLLRRLTSDSCDKL